MLFRLGACLFPVLERTAHEHMLPPVRDTQVIVSSHGADACVMGSIASVLDAVLREPVW